MQLILYVLYCIPLQYFRKINAKLCFVILILILYYAFTAIPKQLNVNCHNTQCQNFTFEISTVNVGIHVIIEAILETCFVFFRAHICLMLFS